MTFLSLCQRTRQECSISGTGPTTVTSQTGEMLKIVDWVLSSYEDIQNKHPNWNFMRFDFTFPTIASTSTYLPSAVSLTEVATWETQDMRAYLTVTGVADETRLRRREWEDLRGQRLIGTIQTGKPSEFAVRPDKSLVFWPTPDAIYTVAGEYWKRAQTMTDNSDEPLVPDQFEMAIVWGAVMYYAADQGAAELYQHAGNEHGRVMRRLEKDQLPPVRMGRPLA